VLFAISAGGTASLFAHNPITTRVTWNTEISRIIEARCVTCHAPGGTAPMSLRTYDEARPWARAIKEAVLTRHMPNWQAVRGYGDFSNDPSLSAFEIALVAAWADGGAPRGAEDAEKGKGKTEKAESARPASQARSSRTTLLPCGTRPLPQATLLAVQPALAKGQSTGISVTLPDGRREIVAWIRNFDPRFPTTYWLRRPLPLPAGSILITEAQNDCAIGVTVGGSRVH